MPWAIPGGINTMTKERWREIVGRIKDNFQIEDEGSYHFDEEGGVDVESIVFNGPLGRMKLEFEEKPVIIDKKTTYSNRIGSETRIEYVYSQSEKSAKLMAYKWDDGIDDWVEMEAKNFGL